MTSHSSCATSILISDPAQLCSARLPVPGPPPPLSPFPPFSPPLSLCSVLSVIPQNTRAPIILRCNTIRPLSSSRPRNARKRSQQPSCPSSSSRCPRSRPRPPLSRPRRNPEPAPSNRYAKTLVFPSILVPFHHPIEIVLPSGFRNKGGLGIVSWLQRRSVMPMLGVGRTGRLAGRPRRQTQVTGLAGPIAGTNRAAIVPSSPTNPPLRATHKPYPETSFLLFCLDAH